MKLPVAITLLITFFISPAFSSEFTKLKMKSAVISQLHNAVELSGKYYVLDRRQKKIFVFNNKKFLFSFAQAGQGPGDLENPITISEDGLYLYSIDLYTGRVSVFKKNGKFHHSFKLKEHPSSRVLALLGDIGIYNNKLIVITKRGEDFFRVYDMKGNLDKIVSKEKEDFKELGHYYNLNIDSQNKKAYVFSRFDGETIVVSLITFKVIDQFKMSTPRLDDLNKPWLDKDKNYKAPKGSLSIVERICLSPLLREKEGLKAICYARKDKESKFFPCITLTPSSPAVISSIELPSSDVRYIKKFSSFYMMIDKEGNIFLKKSLN